MSKLLDFIFELYQSEYRIAYRETDWNNSLIKSDKNYKYKVIKPNKRYWYADPILYSRDGKKYLFLEKYDMVTDKGSIAISYYSDGEFLEPKTIIDESFHMSFPHIFEYKGRTFMIPECSGSHQIRIYENGKTIEDWHLFRSFDYDEIVDVVTYIENDRIYLIASENNLDNLYQTKPRLFYIDNMLEDESIMVDVSETINANGYTYTDRNAGSLIYRDNCIYRIKQESTERDYGRNCIITAIENISETGLKERQIKKNSINQIKVKTNPLICRKKRTHSYAYIDGLEVVDLNVSNWKNL